MDVPDTFHSMIKIQDQDLQYPSRDQDHRLPRQDQDLQYPSRD